MPLCLSYSEQHLICSGCQELVASCPICMESFCRQGARGPPRRHRAAAQGARGPPRRHRAAEQVAQEVQELRDRLRE